MDKPVNEDLIRQEIAEREKLAKAVRENQPVHPESERTPTATGQ